MRFITLALALFATNVSSAVATDASITSKNSSMRGLKASKSSKSPGSTVKTAKSQKCDTPAPTPAPAPTQTCSNGDILHELIFKYDSTGFADTGVVQAGLNPQGGGLPIRFIFATGEKGLGDIKKSACIAPGTGRFTMEDRDGPFAANYPDFAIQELKYVVDGVTILEKLTDGTIQVSDYRGQLGIVNPDLNLCVFDINFGGANVAITAIDPAPIGYTCNGITLPV